MNKTYFSLTGERIDASADIMPIFYFLIEIDKEVKSVLERSVKVKKLKENFVKLLNISAAAFKELKDNSLDSKVEIDANYFKECVEDFSTIKSIRSDFIIIFCYLETLRVLYTAYKLKTSDEKKLRNAKRVHMISFFENFCLNPSNDWVKKNKTHSISANNLVNLRNSLIHFFSVSDIILQEGFSNIDLDNLKIPTLKNTDLQGIATGAFHLMMKNWHKDRNENEILFQTSIFFVKDVVENFGPQIIKDSSLKK